MSTHRASATEIQNLSGHYVPFDSDLIGEIEQYGAVTLAVWIHLCNKGKSFRAREAVVCEALKISRKAYQTAIRNLKEVTVVWKRITKDEKGRISSSELAVSNLPKSAHEALSEVKKAIKNRKVKNGPIGGETRKVDYPPVGVADRSENDPVITQVLNIPKYEGKALKDKKSAGGASPSDFGQNFTSDLNNERPQPDPAILAGNCRKHVENVKACSCRECKRSCARLLKNAKDSWGAKRIFDLPTMSTMMEKWKLWNTDHPVEAILSRIQRDISRGEYKPGDRKHFATAIDSAINDLDFEVAAA